MSRFGKFLLGSAVVAAAAAGVYEFYKDNKAKKTATVNGEPEQEPEDLGENADDLDEEPGDLGDETAQEESPDKDTESEEKYDADDLADSAKKFAERTYTTIKEGADAAGRAINENVVPKVREAIGPKGQDVLKTVGDAAGRMVDVAVDSTKKIVSIVKDETHYSTVDTKSAEETEVRKPQRQSRLKRPQRVQTKPQLSRLKPAATRQLQQTSLLSRPEPGKQKIRKRK